MPSRERLPSTKVADAVGRRRQAALHDAELLRRAFAAWFRSGGQDQPSNSSGTVRHKGHQYVVLRHVRGVLAVYRIRNDGMLKRLRRWPAEIDR
jgi:hypothetical protein